MKLKFGVKVLHLNKTIMFLILLILPLGSCYAGEERAKLFDNLEQKNFEIDQIQHALTKYANNSFGWSALNYAIEVKDFKSALIIAQYCADVNHKDPYKKDWSSTGVNALERLFFQARSDQDVKISLSEDEIQIAHILLDRGIDILSKLENFSPLITACYFNIDDLIIRFIEKGAKVNAYSGYSLYLLIENGNLNMARYLIDNGASINLNYYKLFNAAIKSQKIESIDFLISYGLDISASEDDYLRTAFIFLTHEIRELDGCLHNSFPALEMFFYILEKGTNPNYWILKEGLHPTNYQKALNQCCLWLALGLPSETNAQYFYKNYVIQVLLDHGAVIP